MRTTLSIDDHLLNLARKRAAANGISLGSYVEASLRTKLATPEPRTVPVHLPTVKGGKPRPGVDLNSNRALYDLLDQGGLGA
jgi:hypothetical protein